MIKCIYGVQYIYHYHTFIEQIFNYQEVYNILANFNKVYLL